MTGRVTSTWEIIYFLIGGILGVILNMAVKKIIVPGYFDLINYIPLFLALSIGVYLFIRKMKGVEPQGRPFIIFMTSAGWCVATKFLFQFFA